MHPVLYSMVWQLGGLVNPLPVFLLQVFEFFFLAHTCNEVRDANTAKAARRIDDIYIVMQFADLNIPLPCLDSPGQVLISFFRGHHAIGKGEHK